MELPVDFTFHRPPRDEDQLRGFMLARDQEFWAHFWDPRVGKTKVTNDEFRYNYERGRVDAMVVLAYPSSVHLVWGDEMPKDFPPAFMEQARILIWRRGRMDTRAAQDDMDALVLHDGPKVVTMNCEAMMTDRGVRFLRRLFARWRVMLVVDEDWAVNWTARTRRLLAMAKSKKCVMRRLLTGTPAEEGPQNLYFPCQFLKPGALGFTSPTAFRQRYFEYEMEEDAETGEMVRKKGYNHATGTSYDIQIGYRNLDELAERLWRFSDRVVRRGSTKVYATRYFEMTKRQMAVYQRLRDEFTIDLGGGEMSVTNVLTRMTRLQMVARNYMPPVTSGEPCPRCAMTGYTEEGEECRACGGLGMVVKTTELTRIDPAVNPACDALVEELNYSARPFIIWCRFRQDVEDAYAAAKAVTPLLARYDGSIPQDQRRATYEDFRAGRITGIVATEKSSLSRGHELSRATLAIYYSNEWAARDRIQSEDRTETRDPSKFTDVVDLVAADTRDAEVIAALQEKRDVAALILGDRRF
jgi:hypothetical protein